jgi:hypothetical protein
MGDLKLARTAFQRLPTISPSRVNSRALGEDAQEDDRCYTLNTNRVGSAVTPLRQRSTRGESSLSKGLTFGSQGSLESSDGLRTRPV